MLATKHTLWLEKHDLEIDDEVLARGLSLPEAAEFVRRYGNAQPYLHHQDYDTFRCFELRQHDAKFRLKLVIAATVPMTADFEEDRRRAQAMIDAQTFARAGEFWPGRISTDGEFEKRLGRIENVRKVATLERQIVTELIDGLIANGYRITGCIRDLEPKFRNSRARAGILNLLFDLEMAELYVHKDGETSWIMLIFGEDGFDVIADYSEDLEYLIGPIVDPHLPWNKPGASKQDRGYSVLVLPSPDRLAHGDPKAEEAFDDFVGLMERTFGS